MTWAAAGLCHPWPEAHLQWYLPRCCFSTHLCTSFHCCQRTDPNHACLVTGCCTLDLSHQYLGTADTLLQPRNVEAGLQGLVQQLRSELADARQEASTASQALTASTELAGRLQAHVEIAQEQGAAAVQRVTHEHSRATADLEHRLQHATAALQLRTATAAAEDAEQRGSIQAPQQRLEAALAQSNAAVSKNEAFADTVAQLDSAQSSITIQAAAAKETIAHMQAQVDALRDQLTTANRAAAGAVDTEAAGGTTATGVGSPLQQAAAQHAEEVRDLRQKLEIAETVLQRRTAGDAAAEADRRQAVQALQQQLAEAAEQVLVAQGQVFASAESIAELELLLAAAQTALQQQAESSGSAIQDLESQVNCQTIGYKSFP